MDERRFEDEAETHEAIEDEALVNQSAFQREYEDDHSWEALQEDEEGRLKPLDVGAAQRARRQRQLREAAAAHVRRGMIRYLVLIMDLSRAASMTDVRPSRGAHLTGLARQFIRDFFDQNPLSHVSLLVMRNGRAERLSELSGSPESHIAKLAGGLDAGGDASLQNALQMATSALRSVPPYGHREVLILFSGLSTCDPGNILDTIKDAKKQHVRVSIVGLAAEVYICRQMTEATGGTYSIATSDADIEDRIRAHAPPPPSRSSDAKASLVRMGFPQQNAEGPSAVVFMGVDCKVVSGGYTCPRCKGCVPELPSQCHVCGLTLVSSSQLARSYHHLFPVKPFSEVPTEELAEMMDGSLSCHGCLQPLLVGADAASSGVVLRCEACHQLFCFDCDLYIHDSLHNCPGCEAMPLGADHEMNLMLQHQSMGDQYGYDYEP